MGRRSRSKGTPKIGPARGHSPVDQLAYKPDADAYREKVILTEDEIKRLESVQGRDEDDMRKWAGKLTTRRDVVQILELFINTKIVPMAYRLDVLEAYMNVLAMPWYKRWWTKAKLASKHYWRKIKEIRFVRLGEDGEPQESE